VLASPWGRLFSAWGEATSDARGYQNLPQAPAELTRTGGRAFLTSLGILLTCLREAPEVARSRKKAPVETGS